MTQHVRPMPIHEFYSNDPDKFETTMCMDPLACKMKLVGEGRIQVQPDLATVSIGVITENIQLKIAQEENTRRMNQVLNTLKEMGVSSDDIQTQSYLINPQYDYMDGKQIFRGYRVQHELKITLKDMNTIGEIIDAAVLNGANQVSSITFSVEFPSIYYQKALVASVDDAIAKARTLGKKLGISISDVPVQIVEESYQNGFPIQPYLLQRAEAATQIQPGQTEIIARIDAVFSYAK